MMLTFKANTTSASDDGFILSMMMTMLMVMVMMMIIPKWIIEMPA